MPSIARNKKLKVSILWGSVECASQQQRWEQNTLPTGALHTLPDPPHNQTQNPQHEALRPGRWVGLGFKQLGMILPCASPRTYTYGEHEYSMALHRIVYSTSEKNSHLGRLWQKPHLTFHYIKNNPNSILCKGANTSFSNILAYVKPVTLRNSTMCTWIPFHPLLCLPRDSLHSPKSCTSKGTNDNIHEKL